MPMLIKPDGTFNLPASSIAPDTSNFNHNLSPADNTVQKALETIDNMSASGWGVVTSVNGFTGDVSLDTDDIPSGVVNLYFSDLLVTNSPSVTANTLHRTNEDAVTGLILGDGTGGYSAVVDNSIDWNAAYSHSTTEDAVTGIILGDGAGNYSAVTNNSTAWDLAYSHKTTEDALSGLVKVIGGAYSAITDNSSAWDIAYGWGDHASAGYFVKLTDTLDDILAGNLNVHLTSSLKIDYDNAYTHSTLTSGNPHNVTKTDVGLSSVTNDAQLKRSASDFSTFSVKTSATSGDIVLIEDSIDSGNKKYLQISNINTYAGVRRPTSYIYPLEYQSYAPDRAGAAGYDVDIMALYDPTNVCVIQATSNDPDDYDEIYWEFNLPDNFDGFITTALSIETYSSDYLNTDLEITLNINGSNDGTIAALDINPTADTTFQTKTSAVGTAWTSANANQKSFIKIKFLGDAGDILQVRQLKLGYFRNN